MKTVPAYRPTNTAAAVLERVSDDDRNSPASTSSPDHKRGNLTNSESVNSTSSPTITKSSSSMPASLTCSTSNLNSTSGGSAPGSIVTDAKGDRGGGDSSSVVSSSSSSSKKGKKGRKPNMEKRSGSTEGRLEPSKLSLESTSIVDASSTTSVAQKPDKDEGGENKIEGNTNKPSVNNSHTAASTSNNRASESSSLTTQNSKDLSTTSIHGHSQNSTSAHSNQLKDDATARRSSPSTASGISNRPSSEATNDSSNNGNSNTAATTKPPSVIVKFGKQDGTYYSKKEPTPSHSASMSSSSLSAITTSSVTISSSTSANSNNANINATSSFSGNRPSALTSQAHNHRDHRHGKKQSTPSSVRTLGDSNEISTSATTTLTSTNSLDIKSKLEGSEPNCSVNRPGLPVDCSTQKQPDLKISSHLISQNNKCVVDSNSDSHNKGFTNANFTQSVVTPTSSVGASLFGKETIPRNQPDVSGSTHKDPEYNQARMHGSHSIDRRPINHLAHGDAGFASNKHDLASTVTTPFIKNEPLDFVKKDSNHDSTAASSSRSTADISHNLDKGGSPDKANVDLKLTKHGLGDNATLSAGNYSHVYGSYNKQPYEPSSSSRGEKPSIKQSSSTVVVGRSSHPVPEAKKDSPAKILPISASSTSPEKSGLIAGSSSASFGRPLKVEVSSGSASRSSSLEVSPVKRADDGIRKEISPSRVSKELGYVKNR